MGIQFKLADSPLLAFLSVLLQPIQASKVLAAGGSSSSAVLGFLLSFGQLSLQKLHLIFVLLLLSSTLGISSCDNTRPVSYTHLTLPTICSV